MKLVMYIFFLIFAVISVVEPLSPSTTTSYEMAYETECENTAAEDSNSLETGVDDDIHFSFPLLPHTLVLVGYTQQQHPKPIFHFMEPQKRPPIG